MAETLYATYSDPASAKRALQDLLTAGIRSDHVSLLTKTDGDDFDLEFTRPTTVLQGESRGRLDPIGNDTQQFSAARIERGVDVEINPSRSATSEAGFTQNAAESQEATPFQDAGDPNDKLRFSRGYNALDGASQPEKDAASSDVAKGVATGASIGLGVGTAAALATMLIPGMGLVIGGGALAAAVTAIAAGTSAGAVAGGLVGYLRDHGVPEGSAKQYSSVFDKGGAILAVTVADPEMRPAVERIMADCGAQAVEAHRAYLA